MWRPWKLCHFERGKFWQWTWKVMDHEIGICCDGVWEFSCTWWLEARLKITNLFRNDLNPIIREVIERNLGNFRHCRKGGVSKTKILLKWCLHIIFRRNRGWNWISLFKAEKWWGVSGAKIGDGPIPYFSINGRTIKSQYFGLWGDAVHCYRYFNVEPF